MEHRLIAMALVSALVALPTAVLAHEGHGVKKMGTVTMVGADHVMMKTTDGKELTINVNAKTKMLKGKVALTLKDLKEGTRIVATVASHKAPFTATVIAVGDSAQTPPKKQ